MIVIVIVIGLSNRQQAPGMNETFVEGVMSMMKSQSIQPKKYNNTLYFGQQLNSLTQYDENAEKLSMKNGFGVLPFPIRIVTNDKEN